MTSDTGLSLTEAEGRLHHMITPLKETEIRPLASATGAILGQDLISPINVPASDTAAVDGYAFCHAAMLAAPRRKLRLDGQAHAGHPLAHPFPPGGAIYITTGTPMPQAESPEHTPDTIAMQENCKVVTDADGTWVILPDDLKKGSNFRPCGENIQKDEVALTNGIRLGAAEIGLAAAMGFNQIKVNKPLCVGLLSTGEEVHDITLATDLAAGGIFDSNRPMLSSLLTSDHHQVNDGGIIGDKLDAVTQAVTKMAEQTDAIILSGGSSGGSEDFARQAVEAAGGKIDFSGIHIKPGRPFAAGTIQAKPVFCIPGNPVAVFVTYRLLVAQALTRLAGGTPRPRLRFPVTCGFSAKHKPGRTDFVRVTLSDEKGPMPVAIPHGRFGAGVLTSLTGADGLLEISADRGHVNEGDQCHFIPFREAL
jgi:molybdopterin molybdotransferase